MYRNDSTVLPLISIYSKIEDLSVPNSEGRNTKALDRGGKILIFDEPTAVLTPLETEAFFTVLRKFKEQGKSIVIITHKLQEEWKSRTDYGYA